MPRALAGSIRRSRCLVAALRYRRSAERSRIYRRSEHAGDVDGLAYADHDAADPSRAEQYAGRHPNRRPALRRRTAVRGRRMDLGQDRRTRTCRGGTLDIGVIPAAAAVISAIEDALSPFSVRIA